MPLKGESSGSSGSHRPGEESKDPWSTVPDQREADNYPTRHSDPGEIVPPIPVNTSRWSAELLSALEWKRFEMVCAGLFERLGFAARLGTTGPDGGVDIHLSRQAGGPAVLIVQCKSTWPKPSGNELLFRNTTDMEYKPPPCLVLQ